MNEQEEREHCERAVYDAPIGMVAKQKWLLAERAAADKAGYERGRKDERAEREYDLENATVAGFADGREEEHYAAMADLERVHAYWQDRVNKLQSKYERLTAAARVVRRQFIDTGVVAYTAMRELTEALAETEEKKT